LLEDRVILYGPSLPTRAQSKTSIQGLNNPELDDLLGDQADELRQEIELVQGAADQFDHAAYLRGEQTPVYFGSAMNNCGVQELLDGFLDTSPPPLARPSTARVVAPTEEKFSGFVFKIQANMDPQHRDRIAFFRVCSGKFTRGMKVKHVRLNRDIKIPDALTFMSSDRERLEEAYPGDIIGIHNHGTIRIGDTFTEGERFAFTGIPNFAPELFRRARLRDPLKS
jgi:peptide chain release factor 3